MSELERGVADVVAELQRYPEPDASAESRLRAALAAQRARRGGAIVLTRARAAVLVASVVALTSAGWLVATRWPKLENTTEAGQVAVQFVFVHAGAGTVALVGDFNDWDPRATPLVRSEGGVWSAVVPLSPGRFTYSFVVDQRSWYADPNAAVNATDFGRPSSIVFVSGSETSP